MIKRYKCSGGPQISEKFGSYLKILGARRVIWSKAHNDHLQILGTPLQNFVIWVTWCFGCVHTCVTETVLSVKNTHRHTLSLCLSVWVHFFVFNKIQPDQVLGKFVLVTMISKVGQIISSYASVFFVDLKQAATKMCILALPCLSVHSDHSRTIGFKIFSRNFIF
jgi:hypothetical protein